MIETPDLINAALKVADAEVARVKAWGIYRAAQRTAVHDSEIKELDRLYGVAVAADGKVVAATNEYRELCEKIGRPI